jgi:hypothetical protein
MTNEREIVVLVARHLGLPEVPKDWCGLDVVLPLLERMRAEGAVVLVKLDGERTGPDDNGPYTVAAIGQRMAGDPLRYDTHSLELGLARVISGYARRFWGYPSVS